MKSISITITYFSIPTYLLDVVNTLVLEIHESFICLSNLVLIYVSKSYHSSFYEIMKLKIKYEIIIFWNTNFSEVLIIIKVNLCSLEFTVICKITLTVFLTNSSTYCLIY